MTKAKAKATGTKTAKAAATKKATTPKVVMVTCTSCNVEKPQTTDNFSRLKGADGTKGTGKWLPTCKPCKTASSIAWTTKRADFRKDYQRAVRYRDQLGIPALAPDAKTWKAGDPIMTVEYTDKNGVFHPSRNADEVYAEMKQAQATARAERDAQRAEAKANAKAERDAQRAEAKAERERLAIEAKATRDAQRAEAKAERIRLKAEQATQLAEERKQKAIAKAQERADKATKKAEAIRLEREEKAQKRAEEARLKAEAKAREIAEKADAKATENMDKALAAIANA